MIYFFKLSFLIISQLKCSEKRDCYCCSVTDMSDYDHMNCMMPGFFVLHYLPEFAKSHVH